MYTHTETINKRTVHRHGHAPVAGSLLAPRRLK